MQPVVSQKGTQDLKGIGMTIDHSQSLAIRVAQLIAYCERRREYCDKVSVEMCKKNKEDAASFYDGKVIVYDEVIEKLKLIKGEGE